MPHPPRRQAIVDAALRLFARDGFHATGMDRIASEAGVSKKTLYNHFRSREEVVLAVLAHYDSAFRNRFARRVEARAKSPRARLLAVFDVAADWFSESDFYGCLYINAIGEHSEAESDFRRSCQGFKRRMRDYLGELVEAADLPRETDLRDELALLLEGAIVTAQIEGTPRAARTAKRIAKRLLAEA